LQDPIPQQYTELVTEQDIRFLRDSLRILRLSVSQCIRRLGIRASTLPWFLDSALRAKVHVFVLRHKKDLGGESARAVGECFEFTWTPSRLSFNRGSTTQVLLLILIVLAGSVGIEKAAKAAGTAITVLSRRPNDATPGNKTDVESFDVLEPIADWFP